VQVEEGEELWHKQRKDPKESCCDGSHNQKDLHVADGEDLLRMRHTQMQSKQQELLNFIQKL
jgi:hypothetical protein